MVCLFHQLHLLAAFLVDQCHADRDDVNRAWVVVGLARVAGGRRGLHTTTGELASHFALVVGR